VSESTLASTLLSIRSIDWTIWARERRSDCAAATDSILLF
jgi:hypothetical protein